ncbi:PREDICTED: uncharacterized protein LOC105971349 [Erythranthe guttata]|uniref:uncharacterized protein LOC105971349 n=1 Tax=Erythranthe guttata TaxID=4155 RepID=UPI00064E0F71|nr:PREDICTED: uncharacterized protein LOC105971349 [Erythranthe guttata]|eukprot:XP_012851652.1 PREDICTED: uncharacterized protein LOC105971349 [Erythranthe guttata]
MAFQSGMDKIWLGNSFRLGLDAEASSPWRCMAWARRNKEVRSEEGSRLEDMVYWSGVYMKVTTLNTREAPPAHFMIKIESFSVLEKYGIKKYETKEFFAGDYKWRLIFKFNGKDSDYISVNLAMADTTSLPTNWEVNALFSVFLFNQISGNYLSSTGRTLCFQATKSEWGISKFISRKVLFDPSNGYIIDDSCVFGAEVFVVKREAVIERVLLTNVNTYYNHALEISGFSQLPQRWVSEEFDAGGQKCNRGCLNLYRTLIIYFNGKKCEYVSVSLAMADTSSLPANWEVNVVFNIFLYNQISGNYLSSPGRTRCFLETKSEWGISKFISKKILSDPSNGYLINDNIVFGAELLVIGFKLPSIVGDGQHALSLQLLMILTKDS